MISGDHVELIIAIVDHGSFSAAARALRKAPSAVSMAIGNLEAELGIILFDRSRREPVPTAELIAILPDARLIVDRLRAVRAHTADLASGVEARLTIGIGADINRQPIFEAIQAVAQTYPPLRIDLMIEPQDRIIAALHRAEIDICVAYGGLDLLVEEQIRHLWTETLLAVAAPEHPLIGDAEGDRTIESLFGFRQIVVAGFGQPVLDLRPVVSGQIWQVSDVEAAIDLVSRGLGWANLPAHVVQASHSRIVPVTFSNIRNGLQLPVYLRSLNRVGHGKATQAFIRAVAAAGATNIAT